MTSRRVGASLLRASMAAMLALWFIGDIALAGGGPASALPAARVAQVDQSTEQQLADRYAPVVYLRQVNRNICDTENEGFDPVPVDFVLGREEIPLMTSVNGRTNGERALLGDAPMAADLYGHEQPDYLDYPGSPVRPGCTYRRYAAARLGAEDVPHVAYAHIYLEPGSDELALQYWMFYYFNDWNNDHEGDWEMVMLFFDATTAEEALRQEPTRVVYAQHGGGERADWDAEKLSKEEGHPVVYVARGAHASFYEQHTYLGLADNGTGFGCETTNGPHRRYQLQAIVVPHAPSGPDDPHTWLNFYGRWGEFRRSEWNGPTGPNDKTSWNQPVTWGDGQREASLVVPEFEGFGQAPLDLFCGIVAGGSTVLVAMTRTPLLIAGSLSLVLVGVGLVMAYVNRTVRDAFGYYRQRLGTVALIGAALIPLGYVIATLQTLLFHIPPIEPFLSIMGRFPGVRLLLLLLLGSFEAAAAIIFTAPAVIWAMSEFRQGRTPGIIDAYRHGSLMILPILRARLRVVVRALRRAITVVGIPAAILLIVRSHFVSQIIIHEGVEPDEAIRRSAEAVNQGLARTVLTQFVLTVVVFLGGPLIVIFLLLAIPSRPLDLLNFTSSILFSLMYPLSVVGMTLLFYELRDRGSSALAQSGD